MTTAAPSVPPPAANPPAAPAEPGKRAPHKRSAQPTNAAETETHQARAVGGLEQLAGIAMNALAQKEKTIASDATAALRTVLVDYLPEKGGLPPSWFALSRTLRAHPDFVAMAPDSLDELIRDRAWLEWIGLRQIREVFSEALVVDVVPGPLWVPPDQVNIPVTLSVPPPARVPPDWVSVPMPELPARVSVPPDRMSVPAPPSEWTVSVPVE